MILFWFVSKLKTFFQSIYNKIFFNQSRIQAYTIANTEFAGGLSE